MNYQIELDKVINNLSEIKTLLLHSCCGPCSSYVLEYLSNYFKITVLYYNPNIDSLEEYNKRLDEQKKIIDKLEVKNKIDLINIPYDSLEFLNYTKGLEKEVEGGKRCSKCFFLRMDKTATIAKEKNFDYFTTTLTVSPYKNALKINEIGSILEKKYDIVYLYSDFKKRNGYKRSIELSKQYNLYRQDYCGCIYSKIESEKYRLAKQK